MLIATVADAFLLSISPWGPEGSSEEADGVTIFDRPKSANLRWPEASEEIRLRVECVWGRGHYKKSTGLKKLQITKINENKRK